jgi:hypothetical protein
MMWHEFTAAYLKANRQAKEGAMVNASDAIKQAVQLVYTSRRGDSLFTGPHRHERCANWIARNEETVQRLARRIARRDLIARVRKHRDFAEHILTELKTGRISESLATHYLRCAMNLETW